MDQEFLVTEQIDAGADFALEFNDYLPVSVALWVAPEETASIYLYIASDKIDGTNRDVAYGELVRRFDANFKQWLDLFQIKLINTSDPVAQNAIAIRDRYPASLNTRYNGSSLGGIPIKGALIYPPLSAMKAAS